MLTTTLKMCQSVDNFFARVSEALVTERVPSFRRTFNRWVRSVVTKVHPKGRYVP
jgi:hypothetical protein